MFSIIKSHLPQLMKMGPLFIGMHVFILYENFIFKKKLHKIIGKILFSSCSKEANKEFPNMDPNIVSAISIARRLQDPLCEYVKIGPSHLGKNF